MKTINPGIYLVVNPALEEHLLLEKIKEALDGGISVLQIWNHWPSGTDESGKRRLIRKIGAATSGYDVPVLINEEWRFLDLPELDGVHFDRIPDDLNALRTTIRRRFLTGITCGNDLDTVRWAGKNNLDYISFCSMFPSPSAGNCEIVRPETVRQARKLIRKPIFLSGGITPDNLGKLNELEYDGVAVISGILNADSPGQAVHLYKKVRNQKKS